MKQFSVLACAAVIPAKNDLWEDHLPKMFRARNPRIWRMTKVATEQIIAETGITPHSMSIATALGALDETVNFLDGVFKDGFGSPKNFIASVHNSMGGAIATEKQIQGPNLTYCDGHNSFASALNGAALLDDSAFPLLLVAVDENAPIVKALRESLSAACTTFLADDWQEAAVAFLIDLPDRHSGKPLIGATPVYPGVVGADPEAVIDACIAHYVQATSTRIPLCTSSDSFVKPALTVFDLLQSGNRSTTTVPSYSPSAETGAVVLVSL